MPADSIFTKIINGEVPAFKVYEDDKCIAILDVHPISDGHTLVIPKEQIDHFDDLPDDLYAHVFMVVKKVAKLLKKVYDPQRIGLVIDGYGVPHAHVHVIPTNSPTTIPDPQGSGEPDLDNLKAQLELINSNK